MQNERFALFACQSPGFFGVAVCEDIFGGDLSAHVRTHPQQYDEGSVEDRTDRHGRFLPSLGRPPIGYKQPI